MSGHDHKRWKFGPFASGAYSETGGHWKVLGLMHTWLPHRPTAYELSLFGMFACRWGDGRFQWAFFSAKIEFRRARWRYGEREKTRIRRASKKKWAKAVANAQRS